MVEHQTPERQVGVRSSLRSLCCVLEQDTFTSQKVLVIPRKWWLRPYMTEKLFTGTVSKNQTKKKTTKCNFDYRYYVFINICDFADLPLFVEVKALQSLCCVMFHIYNIKYSVSLSVCKTCHFMSNPQKIRTHFLC